MVDTVGVTGEGTEAEIGTLVTLADIVGVMTGAGGLAETGATNDMAAVSLADLVSVMTGAGRLAETGATNDMAAVSLADIVGVMTGAGRLAETGANTIEVVVVTTTLLEVN